jgi:dTDP-4-dehydrorhamnose 3,5-epimerase
MNMPIDKAADPEPRPSRDIVISDGVFRDGLIEGVVVAPLGQHSDGRGWLVELFRGDELPQENLPQMAYVSVTLPGEARGPHEHIEQSDLFAFLGPGDLRLSLWDPRSNSPTYGHRQTLTVGESSRVSVIIPPGVIHGYKNIGKQMATVLNFPNRLYAGEGKCDPVDEIRHENDPSSPFCLD